MAEINSIQQIVATLRTQLASQAGRGHASGSAPRPAASAAAATPAAQLGSLISRRVKAIDPNDPERRRKTFRIFLESVFLDEFGDNLINDHRFYQMVDAVQQTMEQDPEIRSRIEAAVASLLDAPKGAA